MNGNQFMELRIRFDDRGCTNNARQSIRWAPISLGGGRMNEHAIHGAPEKRREWRIALDGPH